MKSKTRILSLFGSSLVFCFATAHAANITHAVNDGFGASSFASAGTPQKETATAAGTITTAGNLLVTVTSANIVGSPVTLNVPVAVGDAPAVWSPKVVAALNATPAITAQFTAAGTAPAIVLTGVTTPIATTDATLNIAIANGTAAGITPVVTSANTNGATRFWTDGFAPKVGNDYFTATDKMLRTTTATGDVTFSGDSLQIGPRATSVESFVLKGSVTKTITFNSIKLNGGLIGNGDVGSAYTIAGPLSVIAPSGITMGTNGAGAARAITFTSTITGSSPLILGAAITGTPVANSTVTLSGNNSGFSGGVSLGGAYTNSLGVAFNFNPLFLTLKANNVNAFGTGTLTVNGGTLDLNGINPLVCNFTGTGGTVQSGVVGSAILTIGSNDATGGNFAGNVTNGSGTVGITKIGAGSLVLSGPANTYTGDTLVTAGSLSVPATQTGGGNITVSDGATLGVDVPTSGAVLAVNTLITGTSSGATLAINTVATGNPFSAPINATTFNIDAPTVVKLQGTSLTIGSGIPLISYGTVGGTTGLAGLSLQLPARTVGSIDTTTPGLVKANITSFEQVKWNGNISGVWDFDSTGTGASGTSNWRTTITNAAARYLQGSGGTDSVNFTDSAAGTTSITIDGANVTPAGLVFNNTTKSYTFTGSNGIAGTTALIKSGTGSLTLNNPNSFTGGIVLNEGIIALGAANTISGTAQVAALGTLHLNHPNALGSASLVLEDGAKLDNTSGAAISMATVNAQTWNGDLNFIGTNNLNTGIGAVHMVFGSALTTTAGNLTIGGVLSGPGSPLTKKGLGTLTLNGANTYSGGTNIQAGTLSVNAPLENFTLATAFNGLGAGPVDVSAGATLSVDSTTYKSTLANTFSGAGTVNLSSYVADAPAGNYTGEITLTGDWSGFTGNLNLTTPSGKTNRVGAVLTGTFLSPPVDATVSVSPGTTLFLTGTGSDFTPAVSLAGTGNAEQRGAIRLDSVIVSGPVTLLADATVGSSGGTSIQGISGKISGGFQLRTAELGGRTIILSGNNDFSGGTLIRGCSFEAAHNNAFGSGSISNTSSDAGFPGRLIIGDTFSIVNPILLSGTQAGSARGLVEGPLSGTGTVTGPISITAGLLAGGHFATTGGTLVVQGAVTSTVPVTVRVGNITFGGGGSYSQLNVGEGTTSVGANNGISTSAVVDLGANAAATLDLNGFNQQLAGLTRAAAGPATVTNTSVSSNVLTIETAGSSVFPGDVTGNLGLVKSGSGAQTFSGVVAYAGDTTVNAGLLSLSASNSSNDASSVSLASGGATLDLNFSGTETVAKLFIGGVQQTSGVYEAIGNPGTGIEIAQITGTGTLTVTTGSAANDYATWATSNAAGQTGAQDFDNDGVKNAVEYFMGITTPGFTTSPALVGGTVTWPKSATYDGSYLVQTSSDLSNWIPATGVVDGGSSVSFTPPTGSGKLFVRLLVSPN